jgi:tetratricopeptide (TPR) repeat protein
MGRLTLFCLAALISAGPGWAQSVNDEIRVLENRQPDNRTVIGVSNGLLAAGAEAIRYGRYDDGIRLTLMGLERPGTSDANRSAGLSNLCAAHAAKEEPDMAIEYCNESLTYNEQNCRALSNRSYAYWLKEMYPEATVDLEAATAINPRARQILQIRGMLNEAGLRPRVIMEDHQ